MAVRAGSCRWKAVVLSLLVVGSARGVAGGDKPALTSLEPEEVSALAGFTLTLKGSGFVEGAVVYVQAAASPRRFLKFQPAFISSGELQVDLSVGLGLQPLHRSVFVKNPDGQTSEALTLDMVLPRVSPADAPPAAVPRERADQDAGETAPSRSAGPAGEKETSSPPQGDQDPLPRIDTIQPDDVEAGLRFSLLVIGNGFKAGAKVMVLANTGAGGYRAPTYSFRPFEAELLGDTMLEIPFDRGFYPEPRQRELYVVNPDGKMSNRVVLTVLPAPKEIAR